MTPKQKILIGSLVAVFILAIVAVVMYYNNSKAEKEAAQVAESNNAASGGTQPNILGLGLQTWDLILQAIKKKKAAAAGVTPADITVTQQDVYDEIKANPSIMLA
jgi:flagellar basal body-associated protein FliL